jgi:hypothetical protein
MQPRPTNKRLVFTLGAGEVERVGRGHINAVVTRRGLVILGWIAGRDEPIEEIEVLADGSLLCLAPVNLERTDVEAVHPTLLKAKFSGFRVILEADTTGTSQLFVRGVCGNDRIDLGTINVEAKKLRRHRFIPSWQAFVSPRERTTTVRWTVLSPPEEREKVFFGRNDWLFLRRDSNDVIGQQTGKVKLTRKQRRAWGRTLKRRIEIAGKAGAAWQCLVIPDKEFLYPEHLPEEITPARRRPVHDLLDIAASHEAPVHYLLGDLEQAKLRGELFPKTDTHWNQRGSYVAYRAFCRKLSEQGFAIPEILERAIKWISAEAPGGLGRKLYPEVTSKTVRADLANHRARLVFDNRVHNHGRVMVFEQARHEGLKAVIFGESFVQNLLIFLKESFYRLTFVHTSMMVEGILRQENPDVVLSAPLERFLVKVPDDRDALDGIRAEASHKLASGRLSPRDEPFLRDVPCVLDGAARSAIFPWDGSR